MNKEQVIIYDKVILGEISLEEGLKLLDKLEYEEKEKLLDKRIKIAKRIFWGLTCLVGALTIALCIWIYIDNYLRFNF